MRGSVTETHDTRVVSPPSTGRRLPVIDRRVIADVAELGRRASIDLVRELVALFLEDSAGRLTEIRRAATAGDLASVRWSTHGFYSSAGNLGACALAALCEQLETAARDGREAEVNDLVTRLEVETRRAGAALRRIVDAGK